MDKQQFHCCGNFGAPEKAIMHVHRSTCYQSVRHVGVVESLGYYRVHGIPNGPRILRDTQGSMQGILQVQDSTSLLVRFRQLRNFRLSLFRRKQEHGLFVLKTDNVAHTSALHKDLGPKPRDFKLASHPVYRLPPAYRRLIPLLGLNKKTAQTALLDSDHVRLPSYEACKSERNTRTNTQRLHIRIHVYPA